uniref:Uncharacterized protein n=1 Tax=Arundo donax TaxID=35708 RepID=A0A0A8YHF2_ARUDO
MYKIMESPFCSDKETVAVAYNEMFICLALISKRNWMMNTPLYFRKNWGLPSSIHGICNCICTLPPSSITEQILICIFLKTGLMSRSPIYCYPLPVGNGTFYPGSNTWIDHRISPFKIT